MTLSPAKQQRLRRSQTARSTSTISFPTIVYESTVVGSDTRGLWGTVIRKEEEDAECEDPDQQRKQYGGDASSHARTLERSLLVFYDAVDRTIACRARSGEPLARGLALPGRDQGSVGEVTVLSRYKT
jgi:hypothetical protein